MTARSEVEVEVEDAVARRAWAEALELLVAAEELDAEGCELLAVSAHCLGRNDQSLQAWGRAYESHLAAGRPAEAALVAAQCSFALITRGEFALSGGWLARAQALVDDGDLDCPARWFALGQVAAGVMMSGDYAAAVPMFAEAQRNADRHRFSDGMTLSRLGRGQCLVMLGDTLAGLALLDEVMVALTTDAVSPIVAGLAFCAAIECCQQSLDVPRAQEWTAALTRWCDLQPDLVPFRGNCLVHRAEILALHGDWAEAFDQASRARDRLSDVATDPSLGNAYYQLGELHRLRGEHADAEAAYRQASQSGAEAQPGLGLLRLAQGHLGSAGAAIQRALEETTDTRARAGLLAARVEIALASDDLAAARTAADELTAIAERVCAPLLTAQAKHASGAVALASGDGRTALGLLRSAWATWQDLAAPYEGARTRELIGRACRLFGDEDTAELELGAARWVFQELGAAPDLSRLSSAPADPPTPGGLTLREVQVLRLVAAGKTNRAVAEELFLAEKTVHRHVSNIFTKLDVSSRSAATAFAYRHDLV